MRRLFIWHLFFFATVAVRAANLEPGLVGEFFLLKGEIKDFPDVSDASPVVKCVAKTIHYELPNLPFYDPKFVSRFAIHWSGIFSHS